MLKRLRAAFLGTGGIALTATSLWMSLDHVRFLAGSERAEGVVVALDSKRVRATTLYRPVVRFQPAGRAQPVGFTADPGLWPSPWAEGDAVVVAYRAGDPEDARVVSFWMLWFLPIVTAGFGGGCLLAGWHESRQRATPRMRAASR